MAIGLILLAVLATLILSMLKCSASTPWVKKITLVTKVLRFKQRLRKKVQIAALRQAYLHFKKMCFKKPPCSEKWLFRL